MAGNSTTTVNVESGGTGVVTHVGLHALGAFADRLGLGDVLSSAIPLRGERMPVHDRGKVLTQMALVLAGGGESCADIEHLRLQSTLFGSVSSDSTVFRAVHEIDATTRSAIASATASVRTKVWARSAATTGTDPVVLDIDATLVEIHSEGKEQAAPYFRGGFGFRPMFCFSDATGEALSGVLRASNAGSNTVADHVALLDQANAQLPEQIAVGHRAGDDADSVKRQVVVRANSADCTTGFLSVCQERDVAFFATARQNAQLTARLSSMRWASRRSGSAPAVRTGPSGRAPLWPSSPRSSPTTPCRLAPGSSCAGSPSTPGSSAASSRTPATGTGASPPTRTATRSTSTSQCGPTLTSRPTSSA